MDADRRDLDSFLALHAQRIQSLPRLRRGYLVERRGEGIRLDAEFTSFSSEQVPEAFDIESPLTRWFMRQIDTHDPEQSVVVGLVVDGNPLAMVVER